MHQLLPSLGIIFMSLFAPLMAAQTDNHGIHALPRTQPLQIDGNLDDWDLSASISICYDLASLKDIYSAKVAMMYDDEAFYVAIDWKDPHPMGNSHDPQFQANRGWAGDCIQMRIKTDKISHLTAWYFEARQEPAIQISYGESLTKPFGGGAIQLFQQEKWRLDQGAEMAFKAHADGKGYVQEMKLPWALITKDGRSAIKKEFACGIELLWGEADWPVHRYADNLQEGETSREFFWTAHKAWGPVFLAEHGNLSLPTPAWEKIDEEAAPEGPVEIAYTLDKAQRVTIAIDKAQGKRVRNLIASVARDAGAQIEKWDCLDDNGQLVQLGDYTYKALRHDGLHVTYQGSFASPADPPWNVTNGKGQYYGDHTAPEAVCFGPDKIGALACPMGEAGRHLIGVDLTGQRQWGVANRQAFAGGRIALTPNGKTLYIANVDGSTGRYTIWRCLLKTGHYAPWKQVDEHGKEILDLEICATGGMQQMRGIDVRAGKLAVLMAVDRQIFLLDAETGKEHAVLKDMPADARGLCYENDHSLLLIAGDALYRIATTAEGQVQKIASGLIEAYDVTVDAEGLIYVSQQGSAMNVAVLNRQGKAVRHIGKQGGRPHRGHFDETGMYKPAGIAIDSTGKLWVTEQDQQPKRTSIWHTGGDIDESNSLAFDLVGTTAYCASGTINPFDHKNAISESTEYRYDAQRQQWRPVYSFVDQLGTGIPWVGRFARVGKHEYVQFRGTARSNGMVKIFVRESDGGWRHCVEFGNVGGRWNSNDKKQLKFNKRFTGPLWEGHQDDIFCWIDRNDDGQPTPDEMSFVSAGRIGGYYWGQAIGPDLRVVLPMKNKNMTLKVKTITAQGTPVYDFAQAQTVSVPHSGNGEGMLMAGRDGRNYLNQSPLRAVDEQGTELWTYPNPYLSVHGSHKAPAPRDGLIIGASSIYGTAVVNEEIGEVFLMNGNLGQNFIFTEDGLWVQSLFNDCRGWYDVPDKAVVGMPCDAMTAGGESFGGDFCKSDDGRYYILAGATAAVIYECTGFDSLKRFGGSLQVTKADIQEADALRIRRAAESKADQTCTIARVSTAPQMDANLSAWNMDEGTVSIVGGAGDVGKAKACFDQEHLYVAWQVKDKTAMKNIGQDDRLMFITGDCVDLMLRTSDSESKNPVAGDLRVVISKQGDTPIAVIYEQVKPGAKPAEHAKMSSPSRDIAFDRVARIAVPIQMEKIKGGYGVTVALPFKELGITSLAGKTLRGDFGILLSDSTGRECTSRNYWSNQAANNTNDVPDEAVLQPSLWSSLNFAK